MNIWLLRHAVAEPEPPPGGNDHERVLTPGGRADAMALGRRIAEGRLGFDPGELPRVILCSTAVRAVSTFEEVAKALPGLPSPDFRRSIYTASPEEILAEVRTFDNVAMVVGHNPALFALALLVAPDTRSGGFPPCCLEVLTDAPGGLGFLVGRSCPGSSGW